MVDHFDGGHARTPESWWKGHAVGDRVVLDAATDPILIDRVVSFLGPDVVLWGAQYLRREPGQAHAWHADIETLDAPLAFVSVWIGLANATKRSGLTFIAGSHRLGFSIQQAASELGLERHSMSEAEVLALAQQSEPDAAVLRPSVRDGEAVFFTGGVWHCSQNLTEHPRSALLLQYTTPDVAVYIPDHHRLDWPFGFTKVRAPSILVAGRSDGTTHDLRPWPTV